MIRNFWMEANVDGRESVVAGGPKSKDGGMTAVFHVRDKGESRKAIKVHCFTRDGRNFLEVSNFQGTEPVYTIETER